MSTFRSILAAAVAVAATGTVSAQSAVQEQRDSLISSHKYIFFGDGSNPGMDSVRSLVETFYYDQFRNFQDPAAPYFLFMSRDANLVMGIGGQVRMRGYYDWDGSVNGPALTPQLIPVSSDPLHNRALGTTPAGTALFFRVIGRNQSVGTYQLYIEANFNGYSSRDFHLKKAYAIINDWTVGYASSTFGDGAAQPPTIDAAGANMKMDATAVLVRWMHTFKNRYVVAASVETPKMNIQEDGTTTAAHSEYLPNFAAFAQYQWSKDEHIRLAGIVRFLPYRDLLNGKNHTLTGWGLQLSTVFHPAYNWTIYGTVNGGKSYSNYGGDIFLSRYDLVADPETPGRLRTTPGFGYNVGVQYNITPSLFVSTSFGQGRYLPSGDAEGTDYKYGLLSSTNIIWNPVPRIQVGAEYTIGKRQDFNRENGVSQRVGVMAAFSF